MPPTHVVLNPINFDALLFELSKSLINLDIIAIQETWNISSANLNIPNFTGPISKNRIDSRGGGVCFYIKDNLDFKVIDNMSITDKAIEAITIKINHKFRSQVLTCLYRPPKANMINSFYEKLDLLVQMKNHLFPKANFDLLGDFNLNCFDQNTREKLYESCMSNGLLPIITKPTRKTQNTETLIDNILTSDAQQVRTFVLQTNISDHFSMLLSRNVEKKEKTKNTIYTRQINARNITIFKEKLANENWNPIYNLDKVEDIGNLFLDTLQNNFECSFPLKKVKSNSKFN